MASPFDLWRRFNYGRGYFHQSGDDCLRAVATVIEGVVAATNAQGVTQKAFVARYGGEEFAVVIPHAVSDVFELF